MAQTSGGVNSKSMIVMFVGRRKAKILFLLLACLMPVTRMAAQASGTGNWWIYFGNVQLDARWNIWHEVQYRCYNAAGDLEQLLLRGGVGYNLSENNNNILLGYAYIYGRPYVPGTDDKTTTWENRIYQQFLTRQHYGRFYVAHRYRVEERLRNQDMDVRFRYFLSVNVPLNKREMVPGAFYASVYDEIFLNADAPVFDRNRLYGALGYVIRPTLRGEFGFMRQMLEQGGRNQFQVVVFNTFDLVRHED